MNVQLDALLTLPEVAALLKMTVQGCYRKLRRGAFPIRHVQIPYRFTAADVAAYTQRGEVTNPHLLHPNRSRYFASARRRAS